ncbi:hypothetical protein [Pseudomonas sp. TMP9]|uniref:hypothetical protein n=1 Tax=Pseudomonas sp. TMP9 TaxID=3133144 RepID=UPI0030CC33AD
MTSGSSRIYVSALRLLSVLPWGLSAALTVFMIVSLLWFSHYGLDYTDESFYLVSMANPSRYSFSISQFGFIYNPIYRLLGGDVSALRQFNIVIIFFLAWAVCDLFLKRLTPQSVGGAYARLVTSAGIAMSSLTVLVFAGLWLPTPSYNSLAFKGLLIITAGLLLGDRTGSRSSTLGWVLVGLGGWLTFMGKPTTAAMAGLSVIVYALLSGKLSVRSLIALLSFLVCLLVSAFVIDGSVSGFFARYRDGLEFASMLGGGHSVDILFRIDDFQLSLMSTGIFWATVLAAIVGLIASLLETSGSAVIVALMQVTLIAIGLTGVFWYSSQVEMHDGYQNLMLGVILMAAIPVGISTLLQSRLLLSFIQVFIIVLGFAFFYLVPLSPLTSNLGFSVLQSAALLAVIAMGFAFFRRKYLPVKHGRYLVLVVPFLGFTYAYALGTGNNYWIPIGSAGFFIVLSGLLAISHLAGRQEFPRVLFTVSIVVQVITLGLLLKGLEHPYRQTYPLFDNSYAIDLGTQGGQLRLAENSGEYISAARNVFSASGFIKGTPVIDMTGHSPGVLHVIGADSVGVAWTLGGYPGSTVYVEKALKLVSCKQLAQAWLITEPKGPRPLSEQLLASFGASLSADFDVVGMLHSTNGDAQTVYKPAHPIHIVETACSKLRVSYP